MYRAIQLRRVCQLSILAFLCHTPTPLWAQESDNSPQTPEKIPESTEEKAAFMILIADRDGDGKMARSEAPGPMYRDNFGRFDLNGDDVLDPNEIKNAARGMRMSPPMVDRLKSPLLRLDVNEDGKISQAEAEADADFAKNFAEADLDADGQLSEYEVAAKVRTKEVIEFQKTYDPASESRAKKNEPFAIKLAKSWSGFSNSGEYRLGLDSSEALTGQESAYIKATHGSRSFAQFSQTIDAAKFAGKRVELSAQVKAEDVVNGTGVSGVWLRVDGSRMRAFDNMLDRGITQSDHWQTASVVLDIPEDAIRLAVGGIHQGTGTAWFDDFQLRVVDEDISVTQPTTELPKEDQPTVEQRSKIAAKLKEDQNSASLQNPSFETPARWLGIGIQDLKVTGIFPNSLAEELGIQVGDQLLKVDEQEIRSIGDFVSALYAAEGKRRLNVLRDGEELEFVFQSAEATSKHMNASELPAAPSTRRFPRMTEESAKKYVERFDSNGDGLISEDEARGPVSRNFLRYDKNQNGAIDADEILRSGLRVSKGRRNILEMLLSRNEEEEDGKLPLAELPTFFKPLADELDLNSDGFLTEVELERIPEVVQARTVQLGQRSDPDFKPSVANPKYAEGNAPTVAIDAGHNNFHTMDGRYQAFASVLEADGVNVVEYAGKFTAESLAEVDILVVANALPEGSPQRGVKVDSAFSDSEIKTLAAWVEGGGALFLLADHAPYGKAAEKLGKELGVEMTSGFVLGPDEANRGQITFSQANNTLAAHPISKGEHSTPISQVVSFTGQAIRGNHHYEPILKLPPGVSFRASRGPTTSDEVKPDLDGWHQGIVGQLGKGRIAVFGEAGMFSAQVSAQGSRMGMSADRAEQNQKLLINIIHWLNGDL